MNSVSVNSVFGYIATGSLKTFLENCQNYCGLIGNVDNIDRLVEKFWLVENIGEEKPILSQEEEFCEQHFKDTYRRNEDGRFIVKMPMKDEQLGDSKHLANIRLNQLVKRLSKNATLQHLYQDFITEYENLDHMERVDDNSKPELEYYLPHHGVYRPSTKLRVVFNASVSSSNGLSLNDLLLAGAVQEDTFDILVRFRKHQVAVIADIQKMYRQILVDESQRDLLRILWKRNLSDSPVTYRLKTVTYGTKSAPFLAIRCIKQVAYDEMHKYPEAAKAVLSDCYVDDVISGSSNLDSARELKNQLIQLFHSCGMTLHKWNSNSPELLDSPSTSSELSFSSKRLIGPVITKAKIFLQKLWVQKLSWDEPLFATIAHEWQQIVSNLKTVENIKINRCILSNHPSKISLIGYADASEAAYGAVVYLICVDEDHRLVISSTTTSQQISCGSIENFIYSKIGTLCMFVIGSSDFES
ncbi:uncharacterized protein LOC118192962 [Stegodyphus dumicola]|uniref:uncharacterized protein LOC118192962 n=1 Tax=Stegodyphus dumicola TaxID=202533 RepID=UPI0015B20E1E|nr:uncharacterized protein LOC118192962 [Stegodyphus dumicola]